MIEAPPTSLHIDLKTQELAQAFKALGVVTPSEPSIARGAILLGTLGLDNVNPSVPTLNALHRALFEAVKGGKKDASSDGIIYNYPNDPKQLPPALYVKVYKDEEPVPCGEKAKKALQRFSRVSFQRNSATGLAKAKAMAMAPMMVPSPQSDLSQQFGLFLTQFQQQMQSSMRLMGMEPSSSHDNSASSRELSCFVPRAKSALHLPAAQAASPSAIGAPIAEPPSEPLPIEEPEDHLASDFHTADVPPHKSSTLEEEMKNQMKEALAARNAQKKTDENGSGKPKKKKNRLKEAALLSAKATSTKPAAATKACATSILKRPAAAIGACSHKRACAAAPKASAGRRPPLVEGTKDNPPPTTYYKSGKVVHSFSKNGFRVWRSCDPNLRADEKCFKWTEGKAKAWAAALNHLDSL